MGNAVPRKVHIQGPQLGGQLVGLHRVVQLAHVRDALSKVQQLLHLVADIPAPSVEGVRVVDRAWVWRRGSRELILITTPALHASRFMLHTSRFALHASHFTLHTLHTQAFKATGRRAHVKRCRGAGP